MKQIQPKGRQESAGHAAKARERSREELLAIMQTIEQYLLRTRESLERIEGFMEELLEESRTADKKKQEKTEGAPRTSPGTEGKETPKRAY